MSLFHLTIEPQRCAVAYRHGALLGVLGPGRHRRVRGRRLVHVDLRESLLPLATQEVPTADGLLVKVTGSLRWAVIEPVAFVEVSTDPLAHVYLAAQLALRAALADRAVEDVTRRLDLDLTGPVARAGLEVGIDVREVVVKDVILPAELRAATMALATARHRGAVLLEEARAETAALRSLANGAKLLESHPSLARLRLVQAAPPGTRLVIGLDGAAPLDAD